MLRQKSYSSVAYATINNNLFYPHILQRQHQETQTDDDQINRNGDPPDAEESPPQAPSHSPSMLFEDMPSLTAEAIQPAEIMQMVQDTTAEVGTLVPGENGVLEGLPWQCHIL
jgi:hypothetical protein